MKKIVVALFILFLTACSQDEWKESSLFESGSYTMIGEKEKIGFIYDDSENVRFYPNEEQKYMWHLWGSKDLPDKPFKVIATSQKTDEEVSLIRDVTGDANNGADAHIPSIMSLPHAGMWKLDAYVDQKLFGTIFVKVHKK
ncbi:hypothetical protein A374_06991 [Fictibacillus macauensis ZFHKF-1]|uniref:DUF4871 domain-containing protein n=1 Tax=Fictibacillus macauensis ZFHKF-1 TaxID=1196324 RepID=I8J2S3_9BACL|nr:DUF4871 domain-containing protein [Fictibacillus macauensis]EIT86046.1 hypothetical protein A374_06991 [Fictibacillus macauensis ZFHKF-1]